MNYSRTKTAVILLPLGAAVLIALNTRAKEPVRDTLTPLPAHAIQFEGGLEDCLQTSLAHWNKGVVPYAEFVQMFRSGRKQFAQGEMWGKAVRSGSMFYRYTQDPQLKEILRKTVADLLTTRRANGSYSCSEIAKQPDGPGGDLWERKYVLLGLEEYYANVERDPAVLQAMIDEADCTIAQVGPPPKVRIIEQGWSPNHLESSTILEPMMRLYNLTDQAKYLQFATYIVEEGGAKGYNIISDALNNKDPESIGGPYPKAYEMMSLFEGVLEYYRVTGDPRWKRAALNLYEKIRTQEITVIGNGGGDQPYHPPVMGEAWDRTAVEQANPNLKRMMETCTGVTWLKLILDMRCRLLESPHGSNRAADNQQALVRGPVVLARDENIDPDYDKPVMIAATNGHVDVVAVPPTLAGTRMQFRVPTQDGFVQMVDYASVDHWNGKHVRTWLPAPAAGNRPQ